MAINIELTGKHYNQTVFCPYCGNKAIDVEGAITQACEHTVYIATDEAFEYKSEKYEAFLESVEDDPKFEDLSLTELTDLLDFPGAIKFSHFAPPPFGMGAYIAFALIA